MQVLLQHQAYGPQAAAPWLEPQGPPQSGPPVSPWFWMPSVQLAQATHGPPQSTPVSVPFWMPFEQHGPPSSTPVSPPFWMPSEQVAATGPHQHDSPGWSEVSEQEYDPLTMVDGGCDAEHVPLE